MMTEIGPPYDGRRNITKGQKAMGQPRPDLGRQYVETEAGQRVSFQAPCRHSRASDRL